MERVESTYEPDADSAPPATTQEDNPFEYYELQILRSLRKIIRAVHIHSRKLSQNFKITAPQLICLHCLEREGPMTLSFLARQASLGISTTNGIVDRLEAKGLLTRTRSRQDRRKVELAVTQAGRELTGATPPLLEDRFSEALRQLPELEQAAITLSLERVVELMAAGHLDTSPNLVPGVHLPNTTEETRGKSEQ